MTVTCAHTLAHTRARWRVTPVHTHRADSAHIRAYTHARWTTVTCAHACAHTHTRRVHPGLQAVCVPYHRCANCRGAAAATAETPPGPGDGGLTPALPAVGVRLSSPLSGPEMRSAMPPSVPARMEAAVGSPEPQNQQEASISRKRFLRRCWRPRHGAGTPRDPVLPAGGPRPGVRVEGPGSRRLLAEDA